MLRQNTLTSPAQPKRGLVIGKFWPFHLGHLHLVETAAASCEELHVIVCRKSDEEQPDAEQRQAWIRELVPQAQVTIFEQGQKGLPDDGSELWARVTIEHLGFAPDIVFSSEEYGQPWADAMGAEHHLVDMERHRYPISGTMVRTHPLDHLNMLHPLVREWYVPRVVVIGAESTGKTTLCMDVSEELGIRYVPEFGRHYSEGMFDAPSWQWSEQDMLTIAQMQARSIHQAAQSGQSVVLADTDVLVTSTFQKLWVGHESAQIEELIETPDLYIITDPMTPFEQDETGSRRPENRVVMQQIYEQRAAASGAQVLHVSGDRQARCAQAAAAIRYLCSRRNGGTVPQALQSKALHKHRAEAIRT